MFYQLSRGARSLRISMCVKFVFRCLLTEATSALMPLHKVFLVYTPYSPFDRETSVDCHGVDGFSGWRQRDVNRTLRIGGWVSMALCFSSGALLPCLIPSHAVNAPWA